MKDVLERVVCTCGNLKMDGGLCQLMGTADHTGCAVQHLQFVSRRFRLVLFYHVCFHAETMFRVTDG